MGCQLGSRGTRAAEGEGGVESGDMSVVLFSTKSLRRDVEDVFRWPAQEEE